VVACPNRGDIIWLDFEPQTGREIMKRRPALVLSQTVYNRTSGLCIVCPITSQAKGHQLEVPLTLKNKKCAIRAEQVKSYDWRARRATFIQKADVRIVQSVCAIVDALIWGDD
jgi:mRNA interferase MazF